MEVKEFIDNYKLAFGENTELPIAFWFSDKPLMISQVIKGCLFKCFAKVKRGISISLSPESITCGGGKFYTGFSGMAERIPHFVSLIEKYKKTPESVLDFIEQLNVQWAEKNFLNLSRIDKIDSFDLVEGLVFFATPDILSGLTTWAWFDNHSEGAVTTMFGSGCSVMITATINENRNMGERTFLGGFDPSVRPYLKANELIFTIPASRFRQMLSTMRDSCLYGTNAWQKVSKRINR